MLEWIDQMLEDDKDVLVKFDVDSRAKLLKVLVNYGKEPLQAAIAQLRQAESSSQKQNKIE